MLILDRLSPEALTPKLIECYATAILAFIESGMVQGVNLDVESGEFVYDALEPGTSPTDVDLWVSERWVDAVGKLDVPLPGRPGYDEVRLRSAIVERLSRSQVPRELVSMILGQLRADQRHTNDGKH